MSFLLGQDTEYLLGLDGYYLVDRLDEELSTLDVNQTVISQYANSPVIRSVIDSFRAAANPSAVINDWFQRVWNVDTAEGYGLDVWGRIVGVGRMLYVEDANEVGFNEGNYQSFGGGPFYSGALNTANYRLGDEQFRTLILAKARANISAVTAPLINHLLAQIFAGRGRCYVGDPGKMRMILTFEFTLQPWERSLLTQSGVIPRPAGVQLFIQEIDPSSRAGFSEGGWAPFGSGNFYGAPANAS